MRTSESSSLLLSVGPSQKDRQLRLRVKLKLSLTNCYSRMRYQDLRPTFIKVMRLVEEEVVRFYEAFAHIGEQLMLRLRKVRVRRIL